MYCLTKEGKDYIESGFPEINLMELLKEGLVPVGEAKKTIKNFNIALQWAKKNGWVELRNGMIYKKHDPVDWDLDKSLKDVSIGKDVEQRELNMLMQRRLIEKERDDIVKRAERLAGTEVTFLTEELIKTGKWKEVKLKGYNVEAAGPCIYPGKRHPYTAFLDWVRAKLVSFGFEEMTGPLVETEFWNMDALYMPQHHAARDIHDAYFIKDPVFAESIDKDVLASVKKAHEKGVDGSRGWEYQYDVKRAHRHVLRTHGTVLSAKTLAAEPKIPGRYFSIMRCFRYDVIDATHLPDFFQVEGIIIKEGLTIRHLAGILKMFAKEFANTEKIRITPSYFPFTEPSMELQAKHPKLGWIELGGAGIFRKELTIPLGINVPVIAWGLGIDRIAMLNIGVNDIRELFSTNLDYLRSAKVVY